MTKFVSSNWFAAKSVEQMRVKQSQFEQFTPTPFKFQETESKSQWIKTWPYHVFWKYGEAWLDINVLREQRKKCQIFRIKYFIILI